MEEIDEAKFFGIYPGIVVDDVDPLGLNRVRVDVPGIVDRTGWASPGGGAPNSGSAQNGGYVSPKKGATVWVLFQAGDPDHPVYFGGSHGSKEKSSAHSGLSASDVVKVHVYESSRFLIVLDHRGGSESLLLKDKTTGDLINITPAKTHIKATAKVHVEAPIINLGGDPLIPLTDGVVLASGVDPFTGATYGVLGNASARVMAKKV